MFQIPILVIIYNRPELTKITFDQIKKINPKILYIAADGPNPNKVYDEDKCKQTREIVINSIDWQCEIKTLFRKENLGCKYAVSSAINWFFENEEYGIIIEDDILPDQSFFYFCQELLEKYRHDTRIMQINGLNHLNSVDIEYSYYFSKFGPIWGWASWRRAWEVYDINMTKWSEIKRKHHYRAFCDSKAEQNWRIDLFDNMLNSNIATWDYQWVFAKLINSGLCITPKKNLIKNIGFSIDSTHTTTTPRHMENIKLERIEQPLVHPEYVLRNIYFDMIYFNDIVKPDAKYLNKIKNLLWPK